jgi:hypothetical protein
MIPPEAALTSFAESIKCKGRQCGKARGCNLDQSAGKAIYHNGTRSLEVVLAQPSNNGWDAVQALGLSFCHLASVTMQVAVQILAPGSQPT